MEAAPEAESGGTSAREEDVGVGAAAAAADKSDTDAAAAATSDYYQGGSSELMGTKHGSFSSMRARAVLTPDSTKLVLALVGLPGRGKSFIARKISDFMNWQGIKCQIFNVGKYRRQMTDPQVSGRANFYDPSNAAAVRQREQAALLCVDEMVEWMASAEGSQAQIAIMDATNTTKRRRQAVQERVTSAGAGLIFVETICDDPELLEENIKAKIRTSPDFAKGAGDSPASEWAAMQDMRNRIANYERAYESIDASEDTYSYIKLWNLQSKVLCNKCFGRIAKSLVPFLMSTHIGPRPVWVVRCADYDEDKPTELSPEGQRFAAALSKFVTARIAAMQAQSAADLRREASQSSVLHLQHASEAAAAAAGASGQGGGGGGGGGGR
eukprot:SAG22_NODE_908_length_6553_cov_5.089247_1_plen_382_part_10